MVDHKTLIYEYNDMAKRLLCITTSFSRTGAPIALYRLLEILTAKQLYDIHLIAYETGSIKPDYIELLGADRIEILDGLPCTEEFRIRMQQNYDIVILNTAVVYPFSFFFQNLDIPVYWWIHEAPEMIEQAYSGFPNPHLLSPNFHLFLPSEGAATLFRTHYSYNASVLHVPVQKTEPAGSMLPVILPDDRVLFFIPAAYTYIKGQDILLQAINELPDNYRQRSLFCFCGYSLDGQAEYKKKIIEIASHLDNVIMLEELPQDSVFALMNNCHCIIAPSRIDCLPTTIVEGLMLHKLVLVSDLTGISYYIQDCINGFVFKSIDELIKRLLLIINDFTSLEKISENGYGIYTDYFSYEAVEASLKEIGLI